MDLERIIRDLRDEIDQIDHAIEVLSSIAANHPVKTSRRGRKSMSEAERRQVSKRMREYWAKKRKETKNESKRAEAAAAAG
jgi:hypothetical protein